MQNQINERIGGLHRLNTIPQLAALLHPAASKKRYLLMLTAYLDESGFSGDPACRFVGMGGLVAESEVWVSFTEKWQAVLDEYIGGAWFHMNDYVLVPTVGVYQGWDKARRNDFMGRLVGVITSHDIRFVGCVVSLDGYEQLYPEHRQLFGDPYYMAFQQSTRGCAVCGLNIDDPFSPEKVAMVYAYQNSFGAVNSGSTRSENQGRAEQLWHAMKGTDIVCNALGTYASDFPKNIQALQAADLFAYELTHYFENLLRRPKDGMRWPLRQMLTEKVDSDAPLLKFYSLEVMVETLMDSGLVEENADIRLAAAMMQLDIKLHMQSGASQ